MPFTKGRKKTGGVKKGKIKKFSTSKELALERMRQKIARKWTKLVNAKIALAEGVWVMKPVMKKGKLVKTKVYQEKPDSLSLEYLFSIMVGKPTEKIDFSGKITSLELNQDQFSQIIQRRAKALREVDAIEAKTLTQKPVPLTQESISEEEPDELKSL